MRYLALTLLTLATWIVGIVGQAIANAVEARLAGREPGGVSLIGYLVVVPIVSAAVVGAAYLLDRAYHNLGSVLVGGGVGLLLARVIFRAFVARRRLNALNRPQ